MGQTKTHLHRATIERKPVSIVHNTNSHVSSYQLQFGRELGVSNSCSLLLDIHNFDIFMFQQNVTFSGLFHISHTDVVSPYFIRPFRKTDSRLFRHIYLLIIVAGQFVRDS